MIRKLLAVGLGAVLAFGSGCKETEKPKKEFLENVIDQPGLYVGKPIIIEGKPLSVAYGTDSNTTINRLAIFIMDESKRPLLCYAHQNANDNEYVKATAAIQAEIDDGDTEPIKITGVMGKDNVLEINSVEASGYKFDL